jgi:hypothetical protein
VTASAYGLPPVRGSDRERFEPPRPGSPFFDAFGQQSAFATDLDMVLVKVREMLIQKNAAYGDSALDPLRVFSKASAEEQIRVRIDDKLSRLARGSEAGEDVLHDLLGYLVLLEIAKLRAQRESAR